MLWLAILAFIVCLVASVGLWWLGAWNPPKRRETANEFPVFQNLPKIMHAAHRGGSLMGPENTMETYKRAVYEFGVDILEIDLQLSQDGHVVLIHDADVECDTNGSGLVSHMTLNRLKELDAAYHFTHDQGFTFPYRGKGYKIPTFKEVLDEFSSQEKLVFFLDFKSVDAVQPALREIAARGLERRVLVGAVFPSVNKEVLKYKHPATPAVADAITMLKMFVLYHLGLLWLHQHQHQVVGYIVTEKTQRFVTPSLLRSLRATGCKVALFGPKVNTEEDIQYYIDVGVQMIVTDRPNVMKNLLDMNKEMAPPQ